MKKTIFITVFVNALLITKMKAQIATANGKKAMQTETLMANETQYLSDSVNRPVFYKMGGDTLPANPARTLIREQRNASPYNYSSSRFLQKLMEKQ
jgi:hypothetical protein